MSFTFLLFILSVVVSEADPCDPTGVPVLEGCYRRCRWWGDPHYDTFDGLTHHFQGKGIFQHVHPCDGDYTKVPFDISAELVQWSSTKPWLSKCVEVIITLYSSSGSVATTVTLSATGPYSGTVSYADGTYYYNGVLSRFVVSGNTVSVYANANQLLPDVVVRFPSTGGYSWEAIVELDEGYRGFVCGLCGYFNDNPADDLLDVDCTSVDFEDKNILEYTEDDWIKLNEVGEATFDEDKNDEPFRPNDLPDVTREDLECIMEARDNCINQFESHLLYDECCLADDVQEFCTDHAWDCCLSDDEPCDIDDIDIIFGKVCPCAV